MVALHRQHRTVVKRRRHPILVKARQQHMLSPRPCARRVSSHLKIDNHLLEVAARLRSPCLRVYKGTLGCQRYDNMSSSLSGRVLWQCLYFVLGTGQTEDILYKFRTLLYGLCNYS